MDTCRSALGQPQYNLRKLRMPGSMKVAKKPPEPELKCSPAFMKGVARSTVPVVTRSFFSGMPASQPSKLQQLYDKAKKILGGGRDPSPEEVLDLKQALVNVPLEELGLDGTRSQERQSKGLFRRSTLANGTNQNFHQNGKTDSHSRAIRYLHIHEEADLSIGIFCLPSNAVIPLHNHPGMTVFSRLLYGTMRLRAYDWQDPSQPAAPGINQPARLVTSQQLTAPEEPMALFPQTGGNIHTFQAITDCAVLDVLAPPYSPSGGRDCTYYREHLPAQLVAADGQLVGPEEDFPPVELEVAQAPEDFIVLPGVYRGLKVAARNFR